MAHEIYSPGEMAALDRAAIAAGPFSGIRLMEHAGGAVADEILQRYPGAAGIDVLCGPGNNGGDGYVVARLLAAAGCAVRLWAHGAPRPGSDAALAAQACDIAAQDLALFHPRPGTVVVDALFGAGVARPLDAQFLPLFEAIASSGARVVAVDLPSGLAGDMGEALGPVCRADLTVTFVRKKPAHLLYPGRALCGAVVVRQIGISEALIRPTGLSENLPELWRAEMPSHAADTHKYRRGHVAVFSGGLASTGAARLSAMAAARSGAGAVTVLSPASALAVNAAHLTSIMVRRVDDPADAFLAARKVRACVLGPGFGALERLRDTALALLENVPAPFTLVLDADAFTAFAAAPDQLFAAAAQSQAELVLTPHEGEFSRLFPDLAADRALSKVARARLAAARAQATVVFKGPDTVVADRAGDAVINGNGTPFLATAGSGDVLAGLVAGLAAQQMPAFAAACAAVWLHAEAGRRFGPGLIAEDLPGLLPPLLSAL